jgi:hypothetical protein
MRILCRWICAAVFASTGSASTAIADQTPDHFIVLHAARLLGWAGQIGELKPGYFADVIAVPGNPLDDIRSLQQVSFVMKDGVIDRRPD